MLFFLLAISIIISYSGAQQEGEIRLVGGTTTYGDDIFGGRVEIYHDNEWGTICNDMSVSVSDSKDADEAEEDNVAAIAKIICNTLDYTTVHNIQGLWEHNYCSTNYGCGNGAIWLSHIVCTGDELSLTDCSYHGWGLHHCAHDEDITIECSGYNGRYVVLLGKIAELENKLDQISSWIIPPSYAIGTEIFYLAGPYYLPNEPQISKGNINYIPDLEIEFDILLNDAESTIYNDFMIFRIGHQQRSTYRYPLLMIDSSLTGTPDYEGPGRLFGEWQDTTNEPGIVVSAGKLIFNQWQHVYCRLTPNYVSVSIDGILMINETRSSPLTPPHDNTALYEIFIGGDGLPYRPPANAAMKNIAIYSVNV